VKEQLRVAAGERLQWKQEDVRQRGWAIECRICAEDPDRDFFPCPGLITRLKVPAGPGVRDDGGVSEGFSVPLDYDPLLSKLIVWGNTRAEAIDRMRRALDEYEVGGIQTNIPFFRRLLHHPEFMAGHMDTGFIDRFLAEGMRNVVTDRDEGAEFAAMLVAALETSRQGNTQRSRPPQTNAWKIEGRRAFLENWPQRARRRF
jgi:acetyl-CoA carboxylase biotin carboxylase subunit